MSGKTFSKKYILGLTLFTKYQPFWLSLFLVNIDITMRKDSHFTRQQ